MKKSIYIILTILTFVILIASTGFVPASASTPASAVVDKDDDEDMEERIKKADVLVYEDPDADLRLMPRINRALKFSKFKGGDVLWTGQNLAQFTQQLQDHRWDLVVLAVESRWTVELGQTGLLEQIYSHLENGGALIVETWNLDEDQSALGGLMLDICDASLEKDWWRDKSAEDYKRSDYMISENRDAKTSVFSYPRKINMPLDPIIFWDGDAGDFIRLQKGSRAKILGGIPSPGHYYGLLTSCLGGRVVLQTFSSHDYSLYESTKLWQNLMYYTLKNHFEALDDDDYGFDDDHYCRFHEEDKRCRDKDDDRHDKDDECDKDDDDCRDRDDDHDCDKGDKDECGGSVDEEEINDDSNDSAYENGSWYIWEVEKGDTCLSIAAALQTIDERITEGTINGWNDKTDAQCNKLEPGSEIRFYLDEENSL